MYISTAGGGVGLKVLKSLDLPHLTILPWRKYATWCYVILIR
jgi:hypothetical protein